MRNISRSSDPYVPGPYFSLVLLLTIFTYNKTSIPLPASHLSSFHSQRTIETMKVKTSSLNSLLMRLLTTLAPLPIFTLAFSVESRRNIPSASDDFKSSLPATIPFVLDGRNANWGYDNWAMICANDREITWDCQSNFFYCNNDGALRRQYDNGRGDGGCPLFCRCQNLNAKPNCYLAYTGMTSCLRDLDQDEHDPSALAARQDTGDKATSKEPSTITTDNEVETQLGRDNDVPSETVGTIEPQVRPGSAPYVGGTVVPATSSAVKPAAGKWSFRVLRALKTIQNLAFRVNAREAVECSSHNDIVGSFELQAKPGAPPLNTPLTSGPMKATAGNWSRRIADVFKTVHKLATYIEKRNNIPMVVAASPVIRNPMPFCAKQLSAMLSSLNRLVG